MTQEQVQILVVDDEDAVRALIRRTLEEKGYRVVTVADGNEGLAKLDQDGIDLVLLDIKMPGLDGFQVLKLIRRRSNLPVIMLTGMDQVSALYDSLNIGADDYITKPFSPLELVARVRAKLRRAKPS
jgi:two-component system OmpR family response regulator/two-component system alkaline phosphatase synthesis response regulator PhoP